jgi:hypothetical protein
MAEENNLEEHLVKRVRELKGITRKVKWIGRNGAPDRLLWLPKMKFPILAELKAKDGWVKPHQAREHSRLTRMGFYVAVWWTKEQIDNFCDARK